MTRPLPDTGEAIALPRLCGKIVDARGVLIRVAGLSLHVGERVRIRSGPENGEQQGEVVGIEGPLALVLPLRGLRGLSPICEVESCGQQGLDVDAWAARGRVIDGLGAPMDGGPPLPRSDLPTLAPVPALARPPIHQPITTGWRAIDGLLTCGEGQRLGIFAPAGSGKSTLLGSIARHVACDTVVLALIGERSREVAEFLERHLGARRGAAIAVVATSDRSPAEKLCAAELAARLACRLRDRGQHVLLLVDSLTRYARAGRELGLALAEPAGSGGFPPSVHVRLAQLVEASGRTPLGSVTAFFTLLCEHDDAPLSEEVRSLMDGHIQLSSALAQAAHFPAVDVLRSQSRLFEQLASPQQRACAARFRHWLSRHEELSWLIQVGEYRAGADPEADLAIAHHPALLRFLRQSRNDMTLAQTCAALSEIFAAVPETATRSPA